MTLATGAFILGLILAQGEGTAHYVNAEIEKMFRYFGRKQV
jgi:hypothetical protein